MGSLIRYSGKRNDRGGWSRVNLEDGSKIWISIGWTNIVIKVSDLGLFGPVLLKENDEDKRAGIAFALNEARGSEPDDVLWNQLEGFCLTAFTQAAIDSRTIEEFKAKLRKAVGSPTG